MVGNIERVIAAAHCKRGFGEKKYAVSQPRLMPNAAGSAKTRRAARAKKCYPSISTELKNRHGHSFPISANYDPIWESDGPFLNPLSPHFKMAFVGIDPAPFTSRAGHSTVSK